MNVIGIEVNLIDSMHSINYTRTSHMHMDKHSLGGFQEIGTLPFHSD